MERDPVCGMTVDAERAAATVEHARKTYYFCCTGCAAKFRAEPDKFLAARPAAAFPVHQIAPLVQLGEPKPAATTAKPTAYICPMDPQVRRDHPGPCPKCGMALEPDVP